MFGDFDWRRDGLLASAELLVLQVASQHYSPLFTNTVDTQFGERRKKEEKKTKEYTVYYNFFVWFANVLSSSKLNISRHTSTTLMSHFLNNFIRNLLTQKSKDLISRCVSGHTSKPYSSIGTHFVLISCKIVSSVASLPTLPNIVLAQR